MKKKIVAWMKDASAVKLLSIYLSLYFVALISYHYVNNLFFCLPLITSVIFILVADMSRSDGCRENDELERECREAVAHCIKEVDKLIMERQAQKMLYEKLARDNSNDLN